jgi:ribonuclease PH
MRDPAGRQPSDLRPLSIETEVNRYAEGSALVRAGHTHVLCTASVDEGVPPWLKGKGSGWVTAEYSMLPRSTHTRSKRDREKVSGRTQEIQRLIGRAFRTVVDLKALGERQIIVDCDVIQADGGTRTASITGGFVALAMAVAKLQKTGALAGKALIDTVSAVSVGIKDGIVLADLDYHEDSACEVDMNFVVTGKDHFVEVQGTAERVAFTKGQLDLMTDAGLAATRRIRVIQLAALAKHGIAL